MGFRLTAPTAFHLRNYISVKKISKIYQIETFNSIVFIHYTKNIEKINVPTMNGYGVNLLRTLSLFNFYVTQQEFAVGRCTDMV